MKAERSEHELIKVKEPPITGVWIFLNNGHCLYRYNNSVTKDTKGEEQIVAGLLSSIDMLFNETLEDRCNVIFGYKHAYYYNYLGFLNHSKKSSLSLISVIATQLEGKFSLSDMLSYETLSMKAGQILVSFFTKFMEHILTFKGKIDGFKEFDEECKTIIS